MSKKTPKKKAAAGIEDDRAQIRLRLFNGAREPLAAGRKSLVRVLDGVQLQRFAQTCTGPEKTFEVPFYDNFRDQYAVIVSADRCLQAGFYPVTVQGGRQVTVDLMIVGKPPKFDFSAADWDLIQTGWPSAVRALTYGASAADAKARYKALLGQQLAAAALWNILTAMRDVHLPQKSPLDYLREIIWDGDGAPTQDRFFAYAEQTIVDQMEMAVDQGAFVPEPSPGLFHEGATRSFKQVAFGEANLQLTFHEKTTKKVDGETWVKIEPDIDYYKDPGAHALLEVLPHDLTGGRTHPAIVYVLRWIAGRQADVPEFNPPYCLVTP